MKKKISVIGFASTLSGNRPRHHTAMVRPGLFRFPLLRTATIRSVLRLKPTPVLPISSAHTGALRPAANAGFRYFHHAQPRLSSNSDGREREKDDSGLTFSQRLKHLIKAYGWYALGMYFLIGAIDFGVAFAAVNLIGAEHVSRAAASAKESVYAIFNSRPPEPGREQMDKAVAQSQAGAQEGLYAMIVLAWAIHKTLFMPLRVGLTAVLTPRMVNWLRVRGWTGSQGTRRAAEELRQRIRRDRE